MLATTSSWLLAWRWEKTTYRWIAKCISRALELDRKVRWIAKVVPVLTLLIKCQLAAGLYVSFTVNSTRRQHHAHASPWGEEYGNMFTSWKNIIPVSEEQAEPSKHCHAKDPWPEQALKIIVAAWALVMLCRYRIIKVSNLAVAGLNSIL